MKAGDGVHEPHQGRIFDYRIRLFEEIASDAMTLINIQFVIASLSISGIGVVSSTGGGVSTDFAIGGGIITASTAVGTVYVHYRSRKRIIDIMESYREEVTDSTGHINSNFRKYILSTVSERTPANILKRDFVDRVKHEYELVNSDPISYRNDASGLRAALTILAAGSISGLALIIFSVLKPVVGKSFTPLVAVVLVFAVIVALLLPFFSDVFRIGEKMVFYAKTIFELVILTLAVLFEVTIEQFQAGRSNFFVNIFIFLLASSLPLSLIGFTRMPLLGLIIGVIGLSIQ